MNLKKIIREEFDDFEWTKDSREPAIWETNALRLMNRAFKDSEYTIELMSQHEAGIYKDGDHFSTLKIGSPVHEWVSTLRKDYLQTSGMFGEDNHVAIEYKKIHNTLVDDLNSWGMAGNGQVFKLIRESVDDLEWIKDIKPNIWKVLDDLTKNNNNINVIWGYDDGEDFYKLTDDVGRDYFETSSIELNLGMEHDEVQNISKSDLLIYLKGNINGTWEFGNPRYNNDRDYRDFMELYRVVDKI